MQPYSTWHDSKHACMAFPYLEWHLHSHLRLHYADMVSFSLHCVQFRPIPSHYIPDYRSPMKDWDQWNSCCQQDAPEEGSAPGSPRRGAVVQPGRTSGGAGGASPGRRGSMGRGRDPNAPPTSRRDVWDFVRDFGGWMYWKKVGNGETMKTFIEPWETFIGTGRFWSGTPVGGDIFWNPLGIDRASLKLGWVNQWNRTVLGVTVVQDSVCRAVFISCCLAPVMGCRRQERERMKKAGFSWLVEDLHSLFAL